MMMHHSITTKIMEAVDITVDAKCFAEEEDAVLNAEEIGEVDVVVKETVIWHITVGLTECVTI